MSSSSSSSSPSSSGFLQGSHPGNTEKSYLSPPPSNGETRLVGAALENLGNTCFLNAVLQCLTHTVPLVQKLLSVDHSSTCSGVDGEFCCFCALREHINLSMLKSGCVIAPTKIADNLNKISSCLQLGEQEDAHEFLHALLDSLDQPCSLEIDSLVKQIFGGRLRSQLRCCDCGHCSDTFEPLLDLSLEIGDADSLTDALMSFTKVEKIDDPEAKFTCGGCNAQVFMEKQLKLDQVPEVVALQLKRFKSSGLSTMKINKFVEYPLELDLNPFLSCPEDGVQLKYDLYAVLVHEGTPQRGHYYCIVRPSPTAWYRMDDSRVAGVSETFMLQEAAFILFYVKQGSSPWFSTLMEAQKIHHPGDSSDASPVSVLDNIDQDLVSPSTGEASCSNSRETWRKDEDPSLCSNHSLVNDDDDNGNDDDDNDNDDDKGACHVAAPVKACYNKSLVEGSSEAVPESCIRHRTRQSIPEHYIIDISKDESLEDEKENHLIPQFQVEPKGTGEVGKPTPKTMKDVPMDESVKRLVREMPSARRSGILACLATKHQALHKEQHLQGKGQRPTKKRRKMSLDAHCVDGEDGPPGEATAAAQLTPTAHQSLSPRSIRRGLFTNDSEVYFELD